LYNVGNTNTGLTVGLAGGEIKEIDQNVSLGALTLTANSKITLTSDVTAGSLRFASATNIGGGTLTIYNWAGTGAGGSDDLIFFTNSTFESSSFLSNVTFFGLTGGARLLSTGELVPITPEPGTSLVGCLLTGIFLRFVAKRKVFSVGKALP
jgi:hypothetical protein